MKSYEAYNLTKWGHKLLQLEWVKNQSKEKNTDSYAH